MWAKGRTGEPLEDKVAADLRAAGKKRDEMRTVDVPHQLVGEL